MKYSLTDFVVDLGLYAFLIGGAFGLFLLYIVAPMGAIAWIIKAFGG